MSRHFMTVCVVCVLCAAHTPCSAHTVTPDGLSYDKLSNFNRKSIDNTLLSHNNVKHDDYRDNNDINDVNNRRNVDGKRKYTKKGQLPVGPGEIVVTPQRKTSMESREVLERLGQIQLNDMKMNNNNNNNNNKNEKSVRRRAKRHADTEERYFLKKIFDAYGDGESLSMEGFEMMLKKLGLLQLIANMERLSVNVTKNAGQLESKVRNVEDVVNKNNTKHKCLSKTELLTNLAPESSLELTKNSTIPEWLFERVCPVLLYHLTSESSLERNGCVQFPDNYHDITTMDDFIDDDSNRNMVQVWVYSTISIVIISLCGLLGVAVIPVMNKSYYHQLLQFLVALAIGTLCGDALIHLLPHAMSSAHSHHHHHHHHHQPTAMSDLDAELQHLEQHNLNMWKGLVAMLGLILFFFTEKALTMIAEWRKYRQRTNKLNKLPARVRVMRENESGTTQMAAKNHQVVGEKLCKHKYSSYPYCYGEITTETRDNHHEHHEKERLPSLEEAKPLTSDTNSLPKIIKDDLEKSAAADWEKSVENTELPNDERESYTVIIREHENKHHGHTHSHGHVHSAPESMSSVAWMVIMGDGLHNFTDGMAIGAAFAANIAGGFSTAIAVFCHELPHELGDFAVLLKAGMSAKQAVFYNLLSSVLCLFGMIFGVLMGTAESATSWVFAAAAGMFIYIALVDMIPELSSGHSEEGGSRWQCILQALGLVTGLGIMFIIALYEHDLQHIFNH